MNEINKEALGRTYEELAKAIVIQAADDYKQSRFLLDTIDRRKYKLRESKEKAINKAKQQIGSVEAFFKSPWFAELSGLDGGEGPSSIEGNLRRGILPNSNGRATES